MTTLILLAGLAMLVALAILATQPGWRLPAVAFALLSVPGNVDNLLPQMTLDPNPLENATAPAISSLDLLLAWAVILTLLERRPVHRMGRLFVAGGLIVLIVASVAAGAALASGVEALAVVRGIVLFARLPALLYLAFALRDQLGNGNRVAAALALGGVILLGNGVYTTATAGLERFTATTFGRNGLAVALAIVAIAAAGSAYQAWRPSDRFARRAVVGCGLLGGLAVFAMLATGTRVSLVMLGLAAMGIAILRPWPASRQQLLGAFATAIVVVAAVGSSIALTAAGGRSFSILSEASDTMAETVNSVTDPTGVPIYSPIRSRSDFWRLAIEMTEEAPVLGVGPFQWNIERYRLDADTPKVVADAHDTYLQIAAEFGIPTLVVYLALSAALVATIGLRVLRSSVRRSLGWSGMALALIALTFPVVELTNSHFFSVRMGPLAWLVASAAVALVVVTRHDRAVSEASRTTDGAMANALDRTLTTSERPAS